MVFKGSRRLSKYQVGVLNCYHSLISSIYGGVCTSQNGRDKGQTEQRGGAGSGNKCYLDKGSLMKGFNVIFVKFEAPHFLANPPVIIEL